jgi:outer membrane receptor protein involved in Fe transport
MTNTLLKAALRGSSCISAVALIGIFAAPAMAQTATPAESEGAAPEASSTIIVTGSRIRRPNLESTVPIASIAGDQFTEQGGANVGDELNSLPQLRSTFSQQNPGSGIGIAGLNLLDLRGLGTQRTLVLVNGRRHVPADILNNAVSPDVNTIPNDLIERVDIVTGGNSAIYGSDAIAGVVNFVLKRNFDGAQLRASAGISEPGIGGNQYVSAMFGKNFADGRGNITLHGEFAHQDRVFASQVPWIQSQDGLFVTDLDPSGLANGSDGVPDRTFITDVRSTTIHRYGLVAINQKASAAACGLGIANGAAGASNAPSAYSCTYIFNPDGTLTPQTGTRFGAAINSGIYGGNGQSGREDKLLSVVPFMERYNFNMLGHYTFSDAAELFVEAKWNRVNALGSGAGPSFIQGQQTQFDVREKPRLDNPFLNAAARSTISSAILASGCQTSLSAVCGSVASPAGGNLTAADLTAIADGSYRFVLARSLVDSGIRDEKFQRDTYRIVAGLRGTFNDDWSYEISANYGKFTESTTTFGYMDKQRFALAMDAGRNPANGQIQCRSQYDAASATVFSRNLSAEAVAANQAKLAADIASCVPYNPFGAADNSAAAKYFVYNATHVASEDQLVLSGFVSGDLSGLFELPGGPVKFALGGEYRREKAYYLEDTYVQTGATNAVVIPTFAPAPFEVKEAFAEVQIPLLKDRPFFYELTLSGAARVAQYQGGTGTVWAYNGGVDWAPIRDIRFRANYSRAVRAPNVSETAFPLVPNFANAFSDPCKSANIGAGTQYRAANCLAGMGATLLNSASFAGHANYSLPIVSGSNPNLKAETSDSLTIGAVIEPRIIPGLSLSVDYYNIKVNGVITSVTAQQIVNGCYDLPTLVNPFCGLFTRFQGPGTGAFGEVPGQLVGNSLIVAPLNYAARIRRGIDVQATYRTKLSENVGLNTNLIYTHNLKISNYINPTDPTFENRILGELGDPVDEFRFDVDLSFKQFTFGYRMRYVGSMWVNAYEDFNSLQGRDPENADYASIQKYPAVFYHDLRFEWNIQDSAGFGKELKFYVGVDNVFAKHPPLGSTATGAGSAIYDYRGRAFYTGVRTRF